VTHGEPTASDRSPGSPAVQPSRKITKEDAVMRAFDAVLFDFGGVFTSSPFELLKEAASGFGVTPETCCSPVSAATTGTPTTRGTVSSAAK
jgi:hypothetical protein